MPTVQQFEFLRFGFLCLGFGLGLCLCLRFASPLGRELRRACNERQRLRDPSSQPSFRPCLLSDFPSPLVLRLQLPEVVTSSFRPDRGFRWLARRGGYSKTGIIEGKGEHLVQQRRKHLSPSPKQSTPKRKPTTIAIGARSLYSRLRGSLLS